MTEDEDTIEMVLNESQVKLFASADAVERPTPNIISGALALNARALAAHPTPAPEVLQIRVTQAQAPQAHTHEAPPTPSHNRKVRVAAILSITAVASVLLAGVSDLGATRIQQPGPVAVAVKTIASPPPAPEPPATPIAAGEAVQFKNPFDRTEVFEFPAGTSKSEARDAVAVILAERARERQDLFVKKRRRDKRP